MSLKWITVGKLIFWSKKKKNIQDVFSNLKRSFKWKAIGKNTFYFKIQGMKYYKNVTHFAFNVHLAI